MPRLSPRLAGLLAWPLLLSLPAMAGAAPAPVTVRLGAWTLMSMQDATDAIPNDGKVFGVDGGIDAVSRALADAGMPTTSIPLGINVLLVRGQGRVMLFDTGLGRGGHGALVERLGQAGLSPAAVTDIFLTHSHGDHVGGLLDADKRPVFPKARVHISAPEWAAMQAEGRDAALVAALRGRVRPFWPGASVVPGVASISLAGHTPGHVGYRIGAGGRTVVDVGDLVHSSTVSLADPDRAMGFDEDKPSAARLRRAMLGQAARTGQLIFAPHFPYPALGRIEAKGGHFAWKPIAGD